MNRFFTTFYIMKYLLFCLILSACNSQPGNTVPSVSSSNAKNYAPVSDSIVPAQYDAAGKLIRLEKTDAAWKSSLSEQEYAVLRHSDTERAFTGDLWDNHEKGIYTCAGCGLPLFSSETKFNSGTGWPSFFQPIKPEYIHVSTDTKYGMVRDEVSCARCGGHQGHVFDDGPQPTGLRYCINSVSLNFVKN